MQEEKRMLDPIVRALVTAPLDYLGTILDLMNRLCVSSPGHADVFHNLKLFLRNGCRMQLLVLNKNFPVWRKVEFGCERIQNDFFFQNELMKVNLELSNEALIIKDRLPFRSTPSKIELVKVTVEELGFPEGENYGKVVERGAQLDLVLFPGEAVLESLLPGIDLLRNETCYFAMNPVFVQDYHYGHNYGFRVFRDHRRGNGKILDCYLCEHTTFLGALNTIVFMKKKP